MSAGKKQCDVSGCNGMGATSTHRFPADKELQRTWIEFAKNHKFYRLKKPRICSKHFEEFYFLRTIDSSRRLLMSNAVPTLFPSNAFYDVTSEVSSSTANTKILSPPVSTTNTSHKLLSPPTISKFSPTISSTKNTRNQSIQLDSSPQLSKNSTYFGKQCTAPLPERNTINHNKKATNKLTQSKLTNRFKDDKIELQNSNKFLEIQLLKCRSVISELRAKIRTERKDYNKLKTEIFKQNSILENKIKILEAEIRTPNKNNIDNEVRKILEKVFTSNQIEIILKKKKITNWTNDEIAISNTIRNLSVRCYNFLRFKLNYPLPNLRTLKCWTKPINMRNGILTDVIKLMDKTSTHDTPHDRLTVLMFDEMKVSELIEHDVEFDKPIGPHKLVQVVMARSLTGSWKKPIYADFDKKMTSQILNDIIKELHEYNFIVVAIVCNCGGVNMGLFKELKITINNTSFTNPITNENIYVFPDVPNLLKLIRNWLLDYGFLLESNEVITKKPLEDLVMLSTCELLEDLVMLSPCEFKISEKHIIFEKSERQNVRKAAELLSRTVATAINHYDLAPPYYSDFIETVNDYFDIMNSFSPSELHPEKCAYGVHLEIQNEVLDKMYKQTAGMRCFKNKYDAQTTIDGNLTHNCLQIFQKGMLIGIKSLQNMFIDLHSNYDLNYIITSKLNQDALKNLFSQIRTEGGLCDQPTPLAALHRIKLIALGKPEEKLEYETYNDELEERSTSASSKPEEILIDETYNDQLEETFTLASTISIFREENEVDSNEMSQSTISSANNADITSDSNQIPTDLAGGSTQRIAILKPTILPDQLTKKNKNENYGLQYIIKLKKKFPDLVSFTNDIKTTEHGYALPSWASYLSHGDSSEVVCPKYNSMLNRLEEYFRKYHTKNVANKLYVTVRLTNRVMRKHPEWPRSIVFKYFRQRLFIRIKYRNAQIKEKTENNLKRKRNDFESQNPIARKMRKIVYFHNALTSTLRSPWA